jgi:putative FmdB family regulatory protein
MTYEYACTSCGHVWEAEQSISAAPLTECPECKQATAKRQVSGGAGFILKGGGWYADLYSSTGAKKAPEAAESGASESKGKSDDKKSADKPKTDAATTSTSTSSSAASGTSSGGSKSTGAAST